MKSLVLLLLVLSCRVASAETADVKYHGLISLDAFACVDVRDAGDITRVCYDAAEHYMVIRLKTTYYHYCEIDAATVQGLKGASSKRQYFETRIRGGGKDGPFDCRTHAIPKKYRR